jgi:hypothetical protein
MFEQRTHDRGGWERGFEAQFAFPVQPAEGCFSGGIAGVVDIQELAARAEAAAQDFVEPFGYALAGLSADAAGGGQAGRQIERQARRPVALREQDQVGLGNLVME